MPNAASMREITVVKSHWRLDQKYLSGESPLLAVSMVQSIPLLAD